MLNSYLLVPFQFLKTSLSIPLVLFDLLPYPTIYPGYVGWSNDNQGTFTSPVCGGVFTVPVCVCVCVCLSVFLFGL